MMSDGANAQIEDSVSGEMSDVENEEMTNNTNVQITDKFNTLLEDESHKILMTIPLESCHVNRSRHLVIVSAPATKVAEDIR